MITAVKVKISPVNDVFYYEKPNTKVKKIIVLDDLEEWQEMAAKLKEHALDYAGITSCTNYQVTEVNFLKFYVKLHNEILNTHLLVKLEKLECFTVKASILMSYITNLKDLFEKKYGV